MYQCKYCPRNGEKEDILQHMLVEYVLLSSVPFFCTLCSICIRDISFLLDHLWGPCLALLVSSMGPLHINRVVDRSATPYVSGKNDILIARSRQRRWRHCSPPSRQPAIAALALAKGRRFKMRQQRQCLAKGNCCPNATAKSRDYGLERRAYYTTKLTKKIHSVVSVIN